MLNSSLGIPGLYYLAPLLCSEKWRSVNLIPKLTKMPILFLAGEKDEVIPPVHMKELYSVVEKHPAKGLTFLRLKLTEVWKSWPQGMHNDTCLQPGYFTRIHEFVREHVYSEPRRKGRTLDEPEKDEKRSTSSSSISSWSGQ